MKNVNNKYTNNRNNKPNLKKCEGCGEQGDVMEDYLILEDGTEVDYINVGWVIKNERL